jgi:oligosaccharide reducing-end xylanase
MREYTNLFAELGIPEAEVRKKIDMTFRTLFFDPQERIYFEHGADMGYMLDTGNLDVRTEGMSYGMMMAVQMDRQALFDRLWRFSKTYMYQDNGKYQGYFAWSAAPDGVKNAQGPAPDGEEYYALALFFAANRWGDREAPFNYGEQARDILRHCLHQPQLAPGGEPMWDLGSRLIKFVPETPFSDPSYHLPHFYELFARWADPEDRPFWAQAAAASRAYIAKASHPLTGLAPEYAEFDGTARLLFGKPMEFYSDAYRVAMNIGQDAAWNGVDPGLSACVDRLQQFFSTSTDKETYRAYMLDGTPLEEPAMHPVAITATNAAGSLAAQGPYRLEWVRRFWDTPLRQGQRRYYDNCLYFFCLLMLAGRYRVIDRG